MKIIKLGVYSLFAAIILSVVLLYISYKSHTLQKGYTGNLHMHTSYSDGRKSYNEMITEAVKLGFDFVAITDHGKIGKETLKQCPEEKRILCIIGEEVYSSEGDILALGITDTIPNDLSLKKTIDMIHAQKGIAIPAHPNVDGHISHQTLMDIKDKIDAVECYNAKYKFNLNFDWLTDYSTTEKVPCVFNSDAHNSNTLENAFNVITIDNTLNKKSLFDAIKKGKTSIGIGQFPHYVYYKLCKSMPFICPTLQNLLIQ